MEGLVSAGVQVSLIVSLYGDSEGYSIMLPQAGELREQREVALPYEDVELLNYIEANEVSQPSQCVSVGVIVWMCHQ